MTEKSSRYSMAKEVAEDLLLDLETKDLPINQSLMKAKRLARLLRDSDVQIWLDLEMKGYPEKFNFKEIGTCLKYAISGGRISEDGKYFHISLPELEAQLISEEKSLSSMGMSSSFSPTVKNYVESGATIQVIEHFHNRIKVQKQNFRNSAHLFSSLKSAIHSYVTDAFLALELGDIVEDTFESTRSRVDSFIRAHCPKVAEQLVMINERINDDDDESRSAALASCRRLLSTVADSIYPAQKEKYIDSQGVKRDIGQEQYKNRILAFIDTKLQKESYKSILESEINHLAARLDSIYNLTCKGVHSEVTKDEAMLTVIQTYLFIAEIAKLI